MQECKIEDAEKLIDAYADEESTTWNYDRSLMLYTCSGITMKFKKAIRQAFDSNKYIPAMPIARKTLRGDSGFFSRAT